jgi:hypothetical protein
MLGDMRLRWGEEGANFTPDFGAVHPQPLNPGIKHVNIVSPLKPYTKHQQPRCSTSNFTLRYDNLRYIYC